MLKGVISCQKYLSIQDKVLFLSLYKIYECLPCFNEKLIWATNILYYIILKKNVWYKYCRFSLMSWLICLVITLFQKFSRLDLQCNSDKRGNMGNILQWILLCQLLQQVLLLSQNVNLSSEILEEGTEYFVKDPTGCQTYKLLLSFFCY